MSLMREDKINEFERKSGKKKSPFLLCTKQKKNPDGNDNLRDVKKKIRVNNRGGGYIILPHFFFSFK